MSLQGPIVVITDHRDAELAAALAAAGAQPVTGSGWDSAAKAIAQAKPAAVVIPDHSPPADGAVVENIQQAIAALSCPLTPVIARIRADAGAAFPGAVPVGVNAAPARVVARLASALRVRTLYETAVRRAETLKSECADLPALPESDPLDDATILVTGRGRSYPALTTAVGERVGLIGALSIETAAKYLNARDVDGIVIGEGFGPRSVEALLTVLSEDARFRDLPIAVLPEIPAGIDISTMPNLERLDGEPNEIVERMLPLVRLHALEARLQRQLTALDAKGMVDPQTGLFTIRAFLRDLDRAAREARERGVEMTIARFSFPSTIGPRASFDAARLVSRLVRSADFACRASDGSILLVFSATALRSAHVVARRIASVLRHTMLTAESPDGKPVRIDPSVTLAALKSADTVESLIARVNESTTIAAQ